MSHLDPAVARPRRRLYSPSNSSESANSVHSKSPYTPPMSHHFVASNPRSRLPFSDSTSSSSLLDPPIQSKPSRILTTIRRPFGHPRRRSEDISKTGMYSTPEERAASPDTRHRYYESGSPPTIEQIAMGLHVSRTPHLRPVRRTSPEVTRPLQSPSRAAPVIIPPPPPPRSSLKKSSAHTSTITTSALSTASVSTLASTAPSTPNSARSKSFRSRMTRLFPGMGRDEALHHLEIAQKEYRGKEPDPPRKAVRFSGTFERE